MRYFFVLFHFLVYLIHLWYYYLLLFLLENMERTHADTGRTCQLWSKKLPEPGIEPRTFLLWTKVFGTLLRCNCHQQHQRVTLPSRHFLLKYLDKYWMESLSFVQTFTEMHCVCTLCVCGWLLHPGSNWPSVSEKDSFEDSFELAIQKIC